MNVRERLVADLKSAMKDKQPERVGCIRMLRSKLQERELALRAKHGKDYELTDEEAQSAIATYAKQRKDSIESYAAGGRDDLAERERAELVIVQSYLPEELSEQELRDLLVAAVSESGATSAKDMGAVMKLAMPKVRGRADGKRVSAMVKSLLEQS